MSDRLEGRTHSARTRPALRNRVALPSCAFCGDDERTTGIKRAPQPGHEWSDTFAIRAEVTDGTPQRPGRALERERHLLARKGPAQPLQTVDAGIAGPANRAGRGRRGNPFVAELVLQQVEQLVARRGHAADPERHGPNGEALRQAHPEGMGFFRAQRREATAPARSPEARFV